MNGNKWQALHMVNKIKRYLGSFKTEEEAAVAYDMHSFLLHGLKVKKQKPSKKILNHCTTRAFFRRKLLLVFEGTNIRPVKDVITKEQ